MKLSPKLNMLIPGNSHILWVGYKCFLLAFLYKGLQIKQLLIWFLPGLSCKLCSPQNTVFFQQPVAALPGLHEQTHPKITVNTLRFFLLISLFHMGNHHHYLKMQYNKKGKRGQVWGDFCLFLFVEGLGAVIFFFKRQNSLWAIIKVMADTELLEAPSLWETQQMKQVVLRGPFYSLWVSGYVQRHRWLESSQWRWGCLLMDFPSLLLCWYQVHHLVPKTRQHNICNGSSLRRSVFRV